MAVKFAALALFALRGLPAEVIEGALLDSVRRDPLTARRLTLLNLIWREGRQTQASLMIRAEARLGRGCFGKRAALAFRRDMQAVRAILAASGYSLRYSRRAEGGYFIQGRPELAPEVTRAIHGAAEELDARQIGIWARLTPSQRLRLAMRLTDDLTAIAVRRLQHERPELSRLEAQREVLHRNNQLPG